MRAIEIKEGESNPTEAVQVPKYETTYLYLDRDRDELYSRINKRVDTMLAMGLEDEARTVHDYKDLNALLPNQLLISVEIWFRFQTHVLPSIFVS
jgi:tRNA dimethylallyltransferase